MSEMIRIRSIPDYLEEFGNNGVGKGVPVAQVKEQILDAFRKEMFDQICWKTKVENWADAPQTPENEKIVQNIFKQTYKKYLGVIKAFNMYKETFNMLKPDDLTLLKEQQEMYDPYDGFDDEDEDQMFCEAEDPEEEPAVTSGYVAVEEDFSDIQPVELGDEFDEAARELSEGMEEALVSGYTFEEEENGDDGRPETDICDDETPDEAHVGQAEEAGTVAEGDYGPESGIEGTADAPAGAVYGNSTEEIRPGMRFPAGFWTR